MHSVKHLRHNFESTKLLLRIGETAAAPRLLAELANNKNALVRGAVAENINTPCEVKLMLAEDDNPDVRFVLAESATTPLEALRRLTEDANPYVAYRAERTLQRLSLKQLISPRFEYFQKTKALA